MKELILGPLKLKNRYIMAPLAGYTNRSLRHLVAINGAALAYTEMVSCSALVYNNRKTLSMLPQGSEGIPIALQLFGGDIPTIKKAITIAEKNGKYDFLDFNMGCPVLKVMKQFSGSYWLKREDEWSELFHTLVTTSHHPVLVKTRLGFDEEHKNVLKLVQSAASEGITAVAIHGRTKTQLYSGQVDYGMIRQAVDLQLLPIIANGDIDYQNFSDISEKTQAAGFMIGRGALGHPQVFADLQRLELNLAPLGENYRIQGQRLLEHFNALKTEFTQREAISMIRGIGPFYFKGLKDSSKIRTALVAVQDEKTFRQLMAEIMSLIDLKKEL